MNPHETDPKIRAHIVWNTGHQSTFIIYTGDFLLISRDQISAPFPIENSHIFSQYHVRFSQIKKI